MKISLIQPGRNNLKYLKWSYASIRKNQGDHEVEICVADDASTDGTWDWCLEMIDKDPLFKAHRNEGPDRLGHTILYDTLINDVATKDIAMIYHADMYLCPGALDAIEREIEDKVIVSLTRIEPPLHPDGPEKVLLNCGVEPEEFKEQVVIDWVEKNSSDKITEGIFAPWAFYKKDFQEIGGHDPLYAPQSKEDSDIFNRFQLNGVKFKQVWDGFVYHMTCRGSRRNVKDKAKNIYEDSPEWLAQNQRSTRNFIRKWGHFVKHDKFMKPVVPNKYDIKFEVINCTYDTLFTLEPWCNAIDVYDLVESEIQRYIETEQVNTIIPLADKINQHKEHDVLVKIDAKGLDNNSFRHIQLLSEILDTNQIVGEFVLEKLFINIRNLNTYTENLIKL
jgi:glycosyltransferase involved in cell wall biosynthesis|tara:strand:- start:1712 stop:2884 length:1173 start_codon:yes stop_codon:yes gene_type:complete